MRGIYIPAARGSFAAGGGRFYTFSICIYLLLVAIPPRICLSDRFLSSTSRTLAKSSLSIPSSRSVTSLCQTPTYWNGAGKV